MKKTLSFLLALMMVIGMMPIHAIAADVPSATITMSTNAEGDLSIGDEFTITASLTENPGYAAMTLKLKWNQSVVQFLGFDTEFNDDEEEVPKDSILGGSIVVNNEVGKITCARTKDNTKTGTLFTAKFKVVGYGECDIGFASFTSDLFHQFRSLPGNQLVGVEPIRFISPIPKFHFVHAKSKTFCRSQCFTVRE